MSTNPELSSTQKAIKTPEGMKMIERVKVRLDAQKNVIRDFFKTNKSERGVLMKADLQALGIDTDDRGLALDVYVEMANEALDELASADELAREKLRDRLEAIKGSGDEVWNILQLLSPEGIVKNALIEADLARKNQKLKAKQESSAALSKTRAKLSKRPSITTEQAEQFQDWVGVREASMKGGGYRGGGEGQVTQEVLTDVGKADTRARRARGFETATGEFEAKAEAFTSGATFEALEEQSFLDQVDKGLSSNERKLIVGLKADYLVKLKNSRKRFESHLRLARKEGEEADVRRLENLAAKEKELLRDLLKAQIAATLEHGGKAS